MAAGDAANTANGNDHDLLIEISTTLKNIAKEITEFKGDHETRLRALETWGKYAVGVIGALQIVCVVVMAVFAVVHGLK